MIANEFCRNGVIRGQKPARSGFWEEARNIIHHFRIEVLTCQPDKYKVLGKYRDHRTHTNLMNL